ncbi:MAG: SMP-30/gluconolactonase/LRE family protein [Desulfobacterales bacterium]|nr:SMP-30/gluconolactonase/LRE family protein [Desulfobacterales bacterium]
MKKLISKITIYFFGLMILFFGSTSYLKTTNVFAQDLSSSSCNNNTTDEAQCKDCCDCIDADAATRKACRDACIQHDFTQNSNFITVETVSVLGPNGDYSVAVSTGNEQSCKEYCDGSAELSCGDRRYCRDACNAKFGNGTTTTPTNTNVPPDQNNNTTSTGNGISIDQAVSDEAQRNTIAFDGLAFLTGDSCGDSFLPPGKVADFSGFQYLRDTDPTNLGHNTDFVTIIAFNMLNLMTDSQIQQMIEMAKLQITQINEYGYKRFPLMNAFRRLLEGDIPEDATGLDKTAVMKYSAELYRLDGEISYGRAKTLGSILRGFSTEQKAKLDALKALNGVGNWDWDSTQRNPLEGYQLDKDVNVAVMTYASEMYSWYAGSVEADTYFCPERQGTYFGSFYMKDAPAMAAGPGFTIDSNLTADMGTSFLGILTTAQAAMVTNLVDIQRDDLNGIVETRRAISTELRKFIVTDSVDEETVLALCEKYGELDGEIVYNYATNFSGIGKTLTTEQKAKLTALRETWNTIPCSGAYLYSEKISYPEVMDTDFMFGVNTYPDDTINPDDNTDGSVILESGATLTELADNLSFAEGPAVDANGNVYFSDILANRIYKWSTDQGLSIFKENSNGINGLFVDQNGNLIACEGTNGRLVSIDQQGNVTVLADKNNEKRFNEPNDLWIDSKGGIYFSDPLYLGSTLYQEGQYVYYLSPKRDKLYTVITDMTKPNGIIGTPDGKSLYVSDHGAGATYRYDINPDGTLTNKTLFTSVGSDGMTIDQQGNVYLTENAVLVFDASGKKIEEIAVPDRPTNLCFSGKTLFITTQTGFYSIVTKMESVNNFTTDQPDVPDVPDTTDDSAITDVPTINNKLVIKIPLLKVNGIFNFWAELAYYGQMPDTTYLWQLTKFGEVTNTVDTSANYPSISDSLAIKIPLLRFNESGAFDLWAELEYFGQSQDGSYLWQLSQYGIITQ